MSKMRAKMAVYNVVETKDQDGNVTQENLTFTAVSKNGGYPVDGYDEDNNYAKWTPSASVTMTVNNLALFGQFKIGEKYYVDFTLAN